MITVIGAGPIGKALGFYLHKSNLRFCLLDRAGVYATSFHVNFGEHNYELTPPQHTHTLEKGSLVFLAVKAYDLQTAVDQHYKTFADRAVIIPLSNGSYENQLSTLLKLYPQFIWRVGMTSLGVSVIDSRDIKIHSQSGKIIWGPFQSHVKQQAIELGLSKSCDVFEYTSAIKVLVRQKWLFNVTINSICAAEKLAYNGAVLQNPELLASVFAEAYQLGEKIWGRWHGDRDQLFGKLKQIIKDTFYNENSMVRDIKLQRRTETNFLAGMARSYPEFKQLHLLNDKIAAYGKHH